MSRHSPFNIKSFRLSEKHRFTPRVKKSKAPLKKSKAPLNKSYNLSVSFSITPIHILLIIAIILLFFV